ncbi:hypothetical protein [Dyadobacter arcticus]|uniref:Glycosyl transferase n=1 Tax=Dyadobacter arcticus TaxID=1078754 RepID=A0ABX0UNW2_9BACT|nr:hypothetical protein [Dyadobacter arcticus]NIJ53355.1 hypothetical protein [Dyadobacter arcticus]
MNIIYTVCNRTNLTHALALANSVAEHQPDHTFYLCWVDTYPIVGLPPHINVLSVTEANVPQWEFMKNQYIDFELLAACRPWFALTLVAKYSDCRQITFFAPTVILLKGFSEILNSSSTAFLTPNIVKPLAASAILDDKRILNIGMFHAGSWILNTNPTNVKVLQWWAERTVDRAKFDLCEGMNMDQLWLNYLPIWVPETSVVRHPGWHYGLHEVLNRKLTFENGKYFVDGAALISIDFAGLSYFDPIWSDYVALLSSNRVFKNFFAEYKNTLKKYGGLKHSDYRPGFGKTIHVKRFRLFRNNIAKTLKSLSVYIDQF